MESSIPIEIHAQKLSEWLISRKHCKKDWRSQITPIRKKINVAIQDMPENEAILQLLTGTYINYFYCKRIIEILKETEADTKNLFGSYRSQRMKDWLEIEKLYLRENLYLAEACDFLVQNIKYHIPLVKKQMAKALSAKTECDRRIEDYTKSIQTCKKDLETLKKQLYITGDDSFKNTLIERLSELKKVYEDVMVDIMDLKKAETYYNSFVTSVHGLETNLTMLQYILKNGNTTYYEYLYGEKPSKIEEPVITIEDTDVEENSGDEEIDWGDLDNPSENTDYGNYGITLEESGIVVESPQTEGIAKGNEALSLLDNYETRKEFFNDFIELESFLSMRLLELSNETNSTLSVQPEEELSVSKSDILSILDIMKVIRQKLKDPVVEHLMEIKRSPRYLKNLKELYLKKVNNIEKMINSQKAVSEKKKELIEEYDHLVPRLKLIQQKNKELISEIECDISKKYKNRPVYIIGTSVFGS